MRRTATGFALTVALAFLVSGCSTPTTVAAGPGPTPSSSAPDRPAPTVVPTRDPTGGAEANLQFFDWVNRAVLSTDPKAGGQAFLDALTEAGFDRGRMEVTADRTAIDLQADSIQFSVRFDDGCLLGQSGEKTGYASMVAPVLGSGRCLIGATEPVGG